MKSINFNNYYTALRDIWFVVDKQKVVRTFPIHVTGKTGHALKTNTVPIEAFPILFSSIIDLLKARIIIQLLPYHLVKLLYCQFQNDTKSDLQSV